MRRFYEMKCTGDDKAWDEEENSEWNGCCEDPYDDEEEENEREWCD